MKSISVRLNDVKNANNRYDAAYHLSQGVTIRKSIAHSPKGSLKVSQMTDRIFYGLRANRIYVSKPECALPFMTGASIMLSDLSKTKLVSKKHTPGIEEMTIHEGWVMITRSGTVGLTSWSNKLHEGKYGSEDIIRVVPKENTKGGIIYAFLASKYGYALLTQGSFGAVIQHIEPAFVGNIEMPIFDEALIDDVDFQVRLSASLREEANSYLADAHKMVSDYINSNFNKNQFKTASVTSKEIWKSLQHRLDPPAIMNDGVKTMNDVTKRMNHTTIGEIQGVVYRPGIFKRNYVESGIPYIKGSEIFLTNPFRRCEHLSRTRTPFIDQMSMKEGQILITCAGSVGDIKLITKEYEDKKSIGSQDIIRLESNDPLYTKEYMFVYLQQPFVYDYIQSMKYGSVIERIEPFHVESIPVVEPTKELSEQITEIVQKYMDCTYRAFNAEEKAIQMVEQEIKKWNK